MKSIWLARILSVGALGVFLFPIASFSQTAINVPKSTTDYFSGDDADDKCTALNESLEDDEKLTYTQFLNKDYCEKKLAALEREGELDLETLNTAVDDAQSELTTEEGNLAEAQGEYDKAVADKALADAELSRLEGVLAAKQAEKDAKAASLAEAYNKVLADYFASTDTEITSFDDYLDAFADDANVKAYIEAKEEFDAGRDAVILAQTNVTEYEEGDWDAAREAVDTAAETLWGDGGSASSPKEDSVLYTYNEAVKAKIAAEKEVADAEEELADLNAAADAALNANVAGTRNDDILASNDSNPAKAVLEASLCAASGDEASDACGSSAAGDDVGQTIVDGFDSLHQKDKELDGRLTMAEGDIVDLQEGLATETSERKAADTVLQANIDKEVSDRKAADTVLQANIDKEVSDRKAADTVLQTAITKEVADRTAADLVLDNKITTVNNRVTQLGERVDALTKESRQGIAMAMALAAIPTVNYGKFSLGVGIGTFASETAAALGMDFVISERVKFKVGFTTTGDESGGSAGFAIGF